MALCTKLNMWGHAGWHEAEKGSVEWHRAEQGGMGPIRVAHEAWDHARQHRTEWRQVGLHETEQSPRGVRQGGTELSRAKQAEVTKQHEVNKGSAGQHRAEQGRVVQCLIPPYKSDLTCGLAPNHLSSL